MRSFRSAAGRYPRQFWLMFVGMLISTIGSSMIWPFLMIYVSERLGLPLTTAASLLTLNAVMGLLFAFVAGPVTDWFGRKWVMVISLAVNGLVYLFLSQAASLPAFALLIGLMGAFNPLYRVGADAMMADLIPPEQRVDAYSLMRLSNNVGVALGPAIGGFIASSSYTFAFLCAAAGLTAYSLLILAFGRETLPARPSGPRAQPERLAGYGTIFRDQPFMNFTIAMILCQICAAVIWMLLSVYTKQNYQLPESQYGFIPATNAVMVVVLQIWVTNQTKRFPALPVMGIGTLFYAVGTASVALGSGFWAFWLSMVILTFGELMLVPTATTYAANLAPASMRGRYMSIYGLTWGVASGIGPIFGGVLNDNLGPTTMWWGAGLIGLIGAVSFFWMARRQPPEAPELITEHAE